MRKHRTKLFCFISLLLISNAIAFLLSSDRRWIHLLKEGSHANPDEKGPDEEGIEIPLTIGEWKGELLPIQGNWRFMSLYKNNSGEELELFIVFNFTRPFECLPSVGWRVFLKDKVLKDKGAKLNRLLLEKDERKLLVLSWNQIGKEVFSNPYLYRLKAMKNRIIGKEAPKMLVRLTLPLSSFEPYEVERGTKTAIDLWRNIYGGNLEKSP